MVEGAKNSILNMYEKMSSGIFSQQSLQDKDFKDKAARITMKSLAGENYIYANSCIRKLHQGTFELSYGKSKVIDIFQSISKKIEEFIEKTESLVNTQISDFKEVFKTFEKKEHLTRAKLFRRVCHKNAINNTKVIDNGTTVLNSSNRGVFGIMA